MKCSFDLTEDKRDFLNELEDRIPYLDSRYRDYAYSIAKVGGCREIYRNDKGTPVLYLKRYYIYRGPEREAMIHQFFLGDKGPLHDHPAASWGRILETGYRERLCTSITNGRTEGEYEVERSSGDWSFRPASTPDHDDFSSFHKVKLRGTQDAGNVWTLFIMEKRNTNSWGFRDNGGVYVPFDAMNKLERTDKVQSSPDNYGYGWFPTRKVV